MADILLRWNRERTLNDFERDYAELRKVATIIYKEMKEEWQLYYNPPIGKIKSNIIYQYKIQNIYLIKQYLTSFKEILFK